MELKQVIKEAKKRGWYLQRSKNHYVFKHKKGGVVTVSKTGSEWRTGLEVKRYFINQEEIHNHKGENHDLL